MEPKIEKASITILDVRIAVAIAICVLTATILDRVGLKFTYGEMRLEVIQKMTACISCLLCCQENTKISYKAGVNRLIITAIGGIVGIFVVLLDNAIHNQWIMLLMIILGILVTLFLCKAAKVPYINARIGGVTFILVTCTLAQSARIWYAVFRFASTFYAALVVLLLTWMFQSLQEEKNKKRRKRIYESKTD